MVSLNRGAFVCYHAGMDSQDKPASPLIVPYDSPRELSRLLEKEGLGMSKKFGQNFLVSPHARASIVQLVDPLPGQKIWEVGPGLGALTHELLGKVGTLVTFEIDHGFMRLLERCFGGRPDFVLVPGDVLKTAQTRWIQDQADGGVACVCGNLPYNTASAFIMDSLEQERRCRMIFTVQKEAALRMGAGTDTELYSSFSVQCQARYQVTLAKELGPGLFWPAPEVTSAVVEFVPLASYDGTTPRWFNTLVRSCFAARRKILHNNLKSSPLAVNPGLNPVLEAAESLGIALSRRAETLSPTDFLTWATRIGA